MKKSIFALTVTVLASILMSCSSTKKSTSAVDLSAFGGDWVVVSPSKNATLHFTPASNVLNVTGFLGVNNVKGSIELDGTKVTDKSFNLTKMAGSPQAMSDENGLFAALNSVEKITMSGDRLFFSGKDGNAELVKFNLTNTNWNVTLIGDDVVSGPYVHFTPEGAASVKTPINVVSMGYDADYAKRKIQFKDGPMTLAAGSEAEMNTERNLLQALFGATTYDLSGNTITLYNASKKSVLTLERE